MGRGALHVTITLAGTAWHVVTAHLKSKLLTFPGGRFDTNDETERARYGVYALDRRPPRPPRSGTGPPPLTGDGPTQPLLVCGDLNDTMEAATTQLIFGPPGSQIGTGGFDHPDQGDPQRLWNLAPKIAAEPPLQPECSRGNPA